ncbi:hypothetical protein [Streptomyces sp. NPDC056169]|uniref:hypothetical protein n=1 Tax=Streptomyces sp. NPDC056169 TaxID=3345734 RepID=UPI0035D62ABD
MDIAQLRDAYRTLLDAATAVADSPAPLDPPPGEWNADQILSHVSLVTATTLATVSAVTAGANTTYDNRIAQDTWTIERVIRLTGGGSGLRDRIHVQADALCTLAGATLSKPELDTQVPTLLLSHDTALVDQPVRLMDLISGLTEGELPGHTRQLLALLPTDTQDEPAL